MLITPGRDVPNDSPELHALVRDAAMLQQARDSLYGDVVIARDNGFTWREIAISAGMTDHGVADIYRRATRVPGEQ